MRPLAINQTPTGSTTTKSAVTRTRKAVPSVAYRRDQRTSAAVWASAPARVGAETAPWPS